jgi:hypothetical protein
VVKCRRCRDAGWVCERHSLHPWPHGDCEFAGMPCPDCQPKDQRPDLGTDWQSFASLEDLPTQRGSVRSVTIEGDPVTYQCEVRTLRGQGLRPGDHAWIEFGAYWDGTTRHAGHWRKCLVLHGQAGTSAEVHVRLLPSD